MSGRGISLGTELQSYIHLIGSISLVLSHWFYLLIGSISLVLSPHWFYLLIGSISLVLSPHWFYLLIGSISSLVPAHLLRLIGPFFLLVPSWGPYPGVITSKEGRGHIHVALRVAFPQLKSAAAKNARGETELCISADCDYWKLREVLEHEEVVRYEGGVGT